MRARILLLSLGVALLCILVFSLTSAQVYYKFSVEESKRYLRVYMNGFDVGYADQAGALAFSEKLEGARVTIMDGQGNVIADSHAEEIAENHADRSEVADALSSGEGYAVRSSETLGEVMFYYCRSVADGELLVRIAISGDSVWRIFLNSLPAIALFFAMDLVLCIVLSFVATHFILNPVKELTAAAGTEKRVTSKYRELLPIAEILNGRNRDIEEQMLQLTAEKELVEQARVSKDEFIANVTHEMNTPLTSIHGYAELLDAGGLTESQRATAYKTILAQSERLANLIACIINYSEIDSDDLPAYAVDFSALAREVIGALKPEADKREVRLIGNIPDGVTVQSRHERVSEVLGNLVRNAIRYNRAGGTVTVTLDPHMLVVEDTGIGIAEENRSKIFDRFFTVDKSHSGKNGGFGLGLAVVKKICKKSGWEISVQSTLGEGSKFTVTF